MKNMKLDQARSLIRTCNKSNNKLVNWNNSVLVSWYYDLLISNGAISENAILEDNLVLKISDSHKNEKCLERQTNEELVYLKEEMEKDAKLECQLVYLPTSYTMLSTAYYEWSGENGKADKFLRMSNQDKITPIKNFKEVYGGI